MKGPQSTVRWVWGLLDADLDADEHDDDLFEPRSVLVLQLVAQQAVSGFRDFVFRNYLIPV